MSDLESQNLLETNLIFDIFDANKISWIQTKVKVKKMNVSLDLLLFEVILRFQGQIQVSKVKFWFQAHIILKRSSFSYRLKS